MSTPLSDPPSAPSRPPPRQLVLDLPVREARALEDFLPAPCNRAAYDAVLAWPDWPGSVLCLVGPEGCGKSHLAAVWAARAGAVALRARDLVGPEAALMRLDRARAAVWDDAAEPPDERALLHLLNSLAERRGHLLLAARVPPARWALSLPDLRSRLAAAATVAVAPPDDALLAALLVKQLRDRGLVVAPSLVDYLVARMERSFAGLRRLVRALDRTALAVRRPLGPALARMVLDELAALRDSDAARADGA
ncbi:MAG: DnaA/Hda family protein [Geminicoccaceae bacterium]|nr:DnaA/Hda family protein [Geminicoccaceae bacterium]MCS7269258.1 DnaA/Hda family protein [Geminicoccaceae bacterium]MCX7629991.1 DnaA/Hda family protein [Geminicoccaceae bacterium]MDW8124683.1 DnaA/Hda family protein [Geminicoccaceae bacterium]MDW8342526.1 DnaA/Hda family protein [Geminicoccaceae bacterium]